MDIVFQLLSIIEEERDAEFDNFAPQSGMELEYHDETTMQSANVKFADQHSGVVTHIKGDEDNTRTITDTPHVTLDKFFQRPVEIHKGTWAVGAGLNTVIDPWSLFYNNVRVQNRVTTFAMLRSKLRLKIVINGNGFYYGRAIASYLPFQNLDALSYTVDQEDLVTATQRPKIFMNPTLSMGGEMEIPFHYFLNNHTTISGSYDNLGSLWIRSLNALKHANASTGSVSYSVFAWAEDITLSGLTSLDAAAISPQSGEEIDMANKTGVVSGPATTVSKISGAMDQLPWIGGYAKATSMVAGKVAKAASALGYCRPPLTKAPDPVRPTNVSSLANINVPDTVNKLSLDHKQELTIDPTIAGYGGGDTLDFKEIVSRESYIDTFTWSTSSASDTLLRSLRVDPCHTIIRNVFGKSGSAYMFPSTAAVATPFRYWTGDLRFRIQVVCSNFHKGRLKIVYDPYIVTGTDHFNTNFVEVVDIADKTDFTITLRPGQTSTWMEHSLPGRDPETSMRSSFPLSFAPFGNGVLSIFVLNELTAPNETIDNDVEINVYLSAGDDFEVANPWEYVDRFVFDTQSGIEADVENTPEVNAPEQEQDDQMAVTHEIPQYTPLVFMGESISSFRTLLKRYNRWTSYGPQDFQSLGVFGALSFPFYRGYVPGAIDTTGADDSYNYCNTVMLHWVTTMFSGWRGSIRYKVLPRGVRYGVSTTTVSRTSDMDAFRLNVPIPVSTNQNMIARETVATPLLDYNTMGNAGIAYTNSTVNSALEFEVPFYNDHRFIPGKIANYTEEIRNIDGYVLETSMSTEVDTPRARMEIWVAAGEDFQTFMYTGLPPVWIETIVPGAPA